MLGAVAARNASIDNDYGTTRGPNAADSHLVALVDLSGVELVGGSGGNAPGYARVAVLPADWPPAANGEKSVQVRFPAPTDEWVPAAGWKLIDPDTGTTWDTGDLLDPLYVTSASPDGPLVTVTVAYQTDQTDIDE